MHSTQLTVLTCLASASWFFRWLKRYDEEIIEINVLAPAREANARCLVK